MDESPLATAYRLQQEAAALGFDWPDAASVWAKLEEEWQELAQARNEGAARTAEEWGDVLFTVVNLARRLGVDPEAALAAANARFIARFAFIEAELDQLPPMGDPARLEAMEGCWQRAKRVLAQG